MWLVVGEHDDVLGQDCCWYSYKLATFVSLVSRYFAKIVEQENMGMSQRAFAKLIGKPQSTIARIEIGSMNASTKVLSEIAQATNQRLTIQFSPAF